MKESQDREEEEEEEVAGGGGGDAKPFQKPHNLKTDRKVFRNFEETPTYTGGVSKEAKNRVDKRNNRDRQRGVHASSKVRRTVDIMMF